MSQNRWHNLHTSVQVQLKFFQEPISSWLFDKVFHSEHMKACSTNTTTKGITTDDK
eukprot:m.463239 g.463239  ORF g.463239 m.463239 type:complete len:56 (-) comp21609_c0_seq17:1250-1417(-)